MLLPLAARVSQRIEIGRYGEAVTDMADRLWLWPFVGISLAAAFGWRRSWALGNDWQRGVVAVLAAVGALILSIFAVPAWHYLQFGGLLLLIAASAALGVAGSRWAMKGARGE
jgi:hypothetical protein